MDDNLRKVLEAARGIKELDENIKLLDLGSSEQIIALLSGYYEILPEGKNKRILKDFIITYVDEVLSSGNITAENGISIEKLPKDTYIDNMLQEAEKGPEKFKQYKTQDFKLMGVEENNKILAEGLKEIYYLINKGKKILERLESNSDPKSETSKLLASELIEVVYNLNKISALDKDSYKNRGLFYKICIENKDKDDALEGLIEKLAKVTTSDKERVEVFSKPSNAIKNKKEDKCKKVLEELEKAIDSITAHLSAKESYESIHQKLSIIKYEAEIEEKRESKRKLEGERGKLQKSWFVRIKEFFGFKDSKIARFDKEISALNQQIDMQNECIRKIKEQGSEERKLPKSSNSITVGIGLDEERDRPSPHVGNIPRATPLPPPKTHTKSNSRGQEN